MKRLLILAEGQTESRFVSEILLDALMPHGVTPIPTILTTGSDAAGKPYKGGVTSWVKISRDLRRLLNDTNAVGVTTMLDYYGLPDETPGLKTRPTGSALARVTHVEQAISNECEDRRFRPYLMLHEFEAMLFTDIEKWGHRFAPDAIAELQKGCAGLSPEAINETPSGAPSKRLEASLGSKYDKLAFGPAAIADIGLDTIREACPHFGDWLSWAESLGESGMGK
ncbi:MAG TPA: DUF4276 family protein [Kofleriaceae bacterium]|jgi:hypothetical protein